MIFTVVWLPNAEDRLAELWNSAADKQDVTDAADWIDAALRTNPLKKVVSVDNLFYLRRDPILVLCDIDEGDRMVRVVDVRYIQDD